MGSSAAVAVGTSVGRYRVLAELAEGGMGQVYLAAAEGPFGFKKVVALKFLRPEVASNPIYAQLFLGEARLTALLTHSNICPVLDVGSYDGRPFLAMEYLRGVPLGALRAHLQTMPAGDRCAHVAYLLAQACDGLAAAHDARDDEGGALCLVHRDISPGNIFVTDTGTVRVMDFGLAPAQQLALRGFFGKKTYASPESLRCEDVDARTDIWSLGAVFWELSVGERPPPWTSGPLPTLAHAIEAPSMVDDVLSRCLEPTREQRWSSARELGEAFRALSRQLLRGRVLDGRDIEQLLERAFGSALAEREAAVGEFLRTPVPRSTSGPPLGRLHGRDREVARATELLDRSRVLAIVGLPGVGKSRLAQELAQPTRHVIVDLTGVHDEAGFTTSMARALGVAEARGPKSIAASLTLQRIQLCVLDGIDQLAPVVPEILESLVASAPDTSLVLTARERLQVAQSDTLVLEPLETRSRDGSRSPALSLLLERAPMYAPTDDDAEVLDQLVAALEGIPLAIELAASWLPNLGPRRLLARMDARLDVLGRQGGGSYRGALLSSWQLLTAEEQSAFAQCSVFRGSFDEHAARAVLALERPVEALAGLFDKSLVHVVRRGPGRGRLFMYESVRSFGAERLREVDPGGSTSERHRTHFGDWGRAQAAIDDGGPRTASTLEALALERDNVLQLLGDADPERVAIAALTLAPLLEVRGPYQQLLAMTRTALKLVPKSDARRRSALRMSRGRTLIRLGQIEDAVRELQRAAAPVSGDLKARAHIALAEARLYNGALEEAERMLGLAELDAVLERTRSAIRLNAGIVAHARGDLGTAETRYSEAIALAEAEQDELAAAAARQYLATLRLQERRIPEAEKLFAAVVPVFDAAGDLKNQGMALGNLGILAQEQSRMDDARQRYDRALELLRRAFERPLLGHVLGYRAGLSWELGELDDAADLYDEAIEIVTAIGDQRLQCVFEACRAGLYAARGRMVDATDAFTLARAKLPEDPGLEEALLVHEAWLAVGHFRFDSEVKHWRRAWRRLLRAKQNPLHQSSDDLRYAVRILRAELLRNAVVIESGGKHLSLPARGVVSIEGRPELCAIMDRLGAVAEDEGGPVPLEELASLAWPGVEDGSARLIESLRMLRQFGLDGLSATEHGVTIAGPVACVDDLSHDIYDSTEITLR